ncbi:MAG: hypothetical protein M1817_004108 [Caeruleum heppii]|nr:MAG: hypothetical protein M1817_004108 [Caeruleum heppii]
MTTEQRPSKRKSLRLAYGEDGGPSIAATKEMDLPLPSAKRAKRDDGRGVNGKLGTGATGGTRGKTRAAGYDEEDDGFAFTRTRSTRAKNAAPPSIPVPEEPAPAKKPAPAPRRKKSFSTPNAHDRRDAVPMRRSNRLSGGSTQPHEQPDLRRRKPRRSVDEAESAENHVGLVGGDEYVAISRDATKIALPFSDTPIIKRNKEFRQQNGGTLPHDEVDAKDFYKHIAADGLPEPRRMKQLLTWCATRALGEKPRYEGKDGNARQAARVIQEELIKDFANRSEMSDWFSREDLPPTAIVKKPHPRNVENARKIAELEREVKRLQEKKRAWEGLSVPLPTPLSGSHPTTTTTSSKQPTKAPPSTSSSFPLASAINPTLLSPEDASLLALLPNPSSSSSSSSTTTNPPPHTLQTLPSLLPPLTTPLELHIDTFHQHLHTLTQYQHVANRLAGRALAVVARRLEYRSRETSRRNGVVEVDVLDVLRGLGGVLGGAAGG